MLPLWSAGALPSKEAQVMSNGEQLPHSRPQAGPGRVAQGRIGAELPSRGPARSVTGARPAWLDQFVWSVLWKFVAVSLTTVLLLLLVRELRHLLWLLVVSSFFALAMIPGVEQLHGRWGRRRGVAVGIIYVSVVLFIVLMVWVLNPGDRGVREPGASQRERLDRSAERPEPPVAGEGPGRRRSRRPGRGRHAGFPAWLVRQHSRPGLVRRWHPVRRDRRCDVRLLLRSRLPPDRAGSAVSPAP